MGSKFKCSVCNVTFTRDYSGNRHIANEHYGVGHLLPLSGQEAARARPSFFDKTVDMQSSAIRYMDVYLETRARIAAENDSNNGQNDPMRDATFLRMMNYRDALRSGDEEKIKKCVQAAVGMYVADIIKKNQSKKSSSQTPTVEQIMEFIKSVTESNGKTDKSPSES